MSRHLYIFFANLTFAGSWILIQRLRMSSRFHVHWWRWSGEWMKLSTKKNLSEGNNRRTKFLVSSVLLHTAVVRCELYLIPILFTLIRECLSKMWTTSFTIPLGRVSCLIPRQTWPGFTTWYRLPTSSLHIKSICICHYIIIKFLAAAEHLGVSKGRFESMKQFLKRVEHVSSHEVEEQKLIVCVV